MLFPLHQEKSEQGEGAHCRNSPKGTESMLVPYYVYKILYTIKYIYIPSLPFLLI